MAPARPPALRPWLAAARPRTLPAAVVPVAAGSALGWREGAFDATAAGWCLAVALLLQVGTNLANDVHDHERGADGPGRLGPPRAVASGWIAPRAMRRAAAGAFALAFLAGLPLVARAGWPLLLVGAASVVAGWCYTGGPRPLAYHGLGDVFVVVFFGFVAVAGTAYVHTGAVSAGALLAGLALGALADALLVVNNVRDEPTDAAAGKRTLVVRAGRRFGVRLYAALLAVAAVAIAGLAAWMGSPWPLVALAGMLPALRVARGLDGLRTRADYARALGRTAAALLATGLLLAAAVAAG